MQRIVFITTGYMPVPAVNGGAVETLIESLLNENEKNKNFEFELISTYDSKAFQMSRKYRNTKFSFVKTSRIITFFDKILYFLLVKVLKKDKKNSYKFILKRLEYLYKTSKILKTSNYDKIIIENNPTLFLTLKFRKNYVKYKDKYYYHLHNEINNFYGCYDIMKECKNIICISEYIRNYVVDRLNISINQTSILKNCIDIKRFDGHISDFDKKNIYQKYNIKTKDKILIFTGRIVPEKGILEVVKALKDIKTKNVKLVIVGGNFIGKNDKSFYEEKLEEECKSIQNNIIFTGFVDYSIINKFYAISDVAVLPSLWEEPAGLTILEALSSGVPVITTKSGGIPEYVEDGSAILLNRDENLVKNIAFSIDKILGDKKLLCSMKKNCIINSKKYSISAYFENFTNLIKKI